MLLRLNPEVNFVEGLNPTADIEKTRYYSTDQSAWTDGETNVLEKTMDFYVNVKDYNMVSTDLNQEDVEKQEMDTAVFTNDDKRSTLEAGGFEDAPVDTRACRYYKKILEH